MPGSEGRRCNIYANIKEVESGSQLAVCSGETRYRHLYTTVSSSVEIQIVNTGNNEDEPTYFAIAFQGKYHVTFNYRFSISILEQLDLFLTWVNYVAQ